MEENSSGEVVAFFQERPRIYYFYHFCNLPFLHSKNNGKNLCANLSKIAVMFLPESVGRLVAAFSASEWLI